MPAQYNPLAYNDPAAPIKNYLQGRQQNALMQQEKQQQEFNNNLALRDQSIQENQFNATQERLAKEQEAASQGEQAKQAYAESQWALKSPSKVQAIRSLPHVLESLQRQGIDPASLTEDHAAAFLHDVQMRAASKLGIAPEVPFDQTAEAQKVALQGRQAMDIERLRSQRAMELERLRQRGQAESDARKPPSGADGGNPPPPLPVGALRLVDEAKQAINSSNESLNLVDRAIKTIDSGKVSLGLVGNVVSRARNATGYSSEGSRAYTDVTQTLEKLRNNYLLLAKGVQTEGDAVRAWNSEIGESAQNDNDLLRQQLTKAKSLINQTVAMQRDRIDTVYSNYGSAPRDSNSPVQVTTPQEAAALPAGTVFITPDGQTRVKR